MCDSKEDQYCAFVVLHLAGVGQEGNKEGAEEKAH